MWRDFRPVEESDNLTPTLEFMAANQCASMPVVNGGQMVGLLTIENIGELIMVKAALAGRHSKAGPPA